MSQPVASRFPVTGRFTTAAVKLPRLVATGVHATAPAVPIPRAMPPRLSDATSAAAPNRRTVMKLISLPLWIPRWDAGQTGYRRVLAVDMRVHPQDPPPE